MFVDDARRAFRRRAPRLLFAAMLRLIISKIRRHDA